MLQHIVRNDKKREFKEKDDIGGECGKKMSLYEYIKQSDDIKVGSFNSSFIFTDRY